jgi:hypothetical protein
MAESEVHPRGASRLVEIEECINQAIAMPGSLGASLIDYTTGSTICSAGRHANDDDDLTGSGTASVVRAVLHGPAFVVAGRPSRLDDIVITSSNGYHIIHFISAGLDNRLVLYVWLDPESGNLALAKRSLRMIAHRLVAV